MSDKAQSGWTVDTLKEHFDTLLKERQQHVSDMFTERDKAITEFKESTAATITEFKTMTAANFASRNEIQTAMKNAADASSRETAVLVATLMPRKEAEARIVRNEEDVKAVTNRVNASGGFGQGVKESWGWLVGVIGIGFAVYEATKR